MVHARPAFPRSSLTRAALLAAIGAALCATGCATACGTACNAPPATDAADGPARDAEVAERFAELFAAEESGVEVEGAALVERRLDDDLQGDRHQRWIVRLASGQTLLISHNIDIAPRVPAEPGDRLEFRGVYEWNPKGGVVHWTHRDPAGRRSGGWLRHDGETYR